jgi:hypothetical protein
MFSLFLKLLFFENSRTIRHTFVEWVLLFYLLVSLYYEDKTIWPYGLGIE